MKQMRLLGLFVFLVLLLFAGLRQAIAQENGATHVVSAGDGADGLAEALARASDGDTIEVRGGVYAGTITVDKRVALIGRDWPVIDGGGQGTVLKLVAPNVTVTGFVVRDSGDSLDEENSGIVVEGPNASLENNRLQETLFGIYLREASGSRIRNNEIHSKDVAVPRRGDAIRVWYSNDVLIENNVVEKGRDVVLWYSERLTVRNNEISGGRYGLHFMYCDDAFIEGNRLLNNSVGAFLMYSRRLTLENNTIAANRGPSGYGVGLKDMDDVVVRHNLFLDNRVGAYLDNSPREIDSTGRF
jgi:nitrous oxidase accessory protein